MPINTEELYGTLNELLDEKKHRTFQSTIAEWAPVDIADYLCTHSDEKLLTAFRLLKKDMAADVFAELDSDVQEKIILTTTDKDLACILDDLYVDDAVDCLEELPAGMVKRILRVAKPETRLLINKFLSYPEDCAGSIMTSEYIDLKETMTVTEAVASIRRTGLDKETVYVAYITDKSRILRGIVSLKDLLFADEDDLIGDVMKTDVIFAHTTDDRESVASTISRYDLLALPVVDGEDRLVGIVTVDDAMDVMEEEVTEDMEKMAALVPSDKPYLKSSVFEIWKKRIPWLLLLMVSATFTGQIISGFEASLALFPALVAFIPMLMDTGGNSGGQSSVTVIRGLALGDLAPSDVGKIIAKELRVGVLCGVVLATCNFVKILLVDNLIFHSGVTPVQALVVCLSLVATVIVAKFVGCTLPIAAKKIGFDPAVMASPFITTIVDALSLVIYFRIATWLLGL